MKNDIDFVIPRDELELVEIFEDLLFMRTEKFSSNPEPVPSALVLSPSEKHELGRLGITGRIFRRWYQTTWGDNTFSKSFDGETPRQELTVRYPDLGRSQASLAVELVPTGYDAKVVPRLFTRQTIEEAGGIFSLGRKSLPTGIKELERFDILPAPNYDPDFKNFVASIERAGQQYAIMGDTINLPSGKETRDWQIFWYEVGMALALNMGLKLPHDVLIIISVLIHRYLDELLVSQGNNKNTYINFDGVVYTIWNIFRYHDKNLLPIEDVIGSGDDNKFIDRLLTRKNGAYSLKIWHNLGNLLDEVFLFPADQYFGRVECVWTNKMNFMDDLSVTCQLLKNDLKLPLPSKLTVKQKKFLTTGIEDKVTDIYRLWFAPPTAFRFLSDSK